MELKKVSLILLILIIGIPINFLSRQAVNAKEIEEYEPIAIENPGFEEVNEDGSFPGWTIDIIGPDDGLLTEGVVETGSHFVKSGTQSIKLEDRSPKKGIELKSKRIPIEGGNFYRLRTQVYAAEKSVRIYIKYFNSNGGAISGAEGNILANTPKVWNLEQLEVYAPSEAAYAEIWYYKSPTGMDTLVYLDDVEFAKKIVVTEDELIVPYGEEVQDLGEMVKIGLSQAATFGNGPDGKLYHYITTQGTPSAFTVVDALTGEEIFTERVSGANDTIWGIDQGSDGNIYFASSGKLFRYLVDEMEIEMLGINPTGNTTMYDIKASNDGKIYGSTFHSSNHGKVFEYDISENSFKDLGVAKDGQYYARGLGVTDDYVYIGVGEYSHLMRYDRKTSEMIEINIPDITGTKRMLSEIDVYNGYLFVYAGDRVHVLKEEDYQYIRTIDFQSKISPPSDAEPNIVYYKMGEELFSYDMATDEIAKIDTIKQPLPDTAFKIHQWLTPTSGEFASREVLFSMAAYGETFIFDPSTGTYSTHVAQLPVIGTQINSLEHHNGLLYMGGFQRGMSIYDINKAKIIHDYPSFHQAESIGFLGDSVYFGTYTGAKMYRMNLYETIDYNQFGWGNPGFALQIENQNRPYVMTSGDDKLFIGTFPSGGTFEGSLTMMEETKDEVTGKVNGVTSISYPNIADNRTVIGLTYHVGKLFGSTTVFSGSGSVNPQPLQDEAIIFRFNPDTGEIERSIIPEIEGVDGKVQIIGDLSVGPDGLIWGVLDGFIDPTNGFDAAIFAMNPDTLEIVKSKVITKSPYSTSKYRPYFIRWGGDGLIYTTIGRQLFAIDPENLNSKQMLPGTTVNLMTMADNGDIYFVNGSKLFKLAKLKDAEEPYITDVDVLDRIEVEFGTNRDDLDLPGKVNVTLSNGVLVHADVTWDEGTPAYDGFTVGTYQFTGTVDSNINNPDGITASLDVVVHEASEESIELLLDKLSEKLEVYINSNEIRGPLVNQLRNSLKQAEYYLNKGSELKALEFVEKFIKHMNNMPMQKHIDEQAKRDLSTMAEVLVNHRR